MALDFGAGLMALDVKKDRRKQEEAAQKESESRGLFGSIGGLIGSFLPIILAPVTGGTSLLMSAAIAGAGAAAGQYAGRKIGDAQHKDITTKFGQQTTKDIYNSLQKADQGAILKAGITSAVSSYMMPQMGGLSDSAKVSHVTKGLEVGTKEYTKAVAGLGLDPSVAMDFATAGLEGDAFTEAMGQLGDVGVFDIAEAGEFGTQLSAEAQAYNESLMGNYQMPRLERESIADTLDAAPIQPIDSTTFPGLGPGYNPPPTPEPFMPSSVTRAAEEYNNLGLGVGTYEEPTYPGISGGGGGFHPSQLYNNPDDYWNESSNDLMGGLLGITDTGSESENVGDWGGMGYQPTAGQKYE